MSMFFLSNNSNPNSQAGSPSARSDSQWTANTQSNENSPSRFSLRSQSIGSSYSEATTCASTSTSAIKTRQINNLKLEVEMRDQRINELQSAVEDSKRQSECQQGQLFAKLEEQTHKSDELSKCQSELKGTVEAQMKQLDDMRKAHEALMATFQQMANKCSTLESEAEQLRKEKEQAQAFEKEVQEFFKMESNVRRALGAECEDDMEGMRGDEKLQLRRARIAERARIQIEEEEAALLQQAIAQKRAQLTANQQPIVARQQQQQQQQQQQAPQGGRQQQYVAGGQNQNQNQQQRPMMQQQQQQQGRPVQQQQGRPVQQQQQPPQDGKKCVIA